jgi:hypothetical protein
MSSTSTITTCQHNPIASIGTGTVTDSVRTIAIEMLEKIRAVPGTADIADSASRDK